MEKRYEIFDHTADLGLRVFGKNKKDLLENAGHAIFHLITDLQKVDERETIELSIEGNGFVDLMINWLREILYIWNGREFLIRSFEIQMLGDDHLNAKLKGEKFDSNRHIVRMEIKAVTYHKARVGRTKNGWWARVILDI